MKKLILLLGFILLDFYDSPLTSYAACFVKTADKYQIDWKLVPAITGVERLWLECMKQIENFQTQTSNLTI